MQDFEKLAAQLREELAAREVALLELAQRAAAPHPPRPTTPEETSCRENLRALEDFYTGWSTCLRDHSEATSLLAELEQRWALERAGTLMALGFAYRSDGRVNDAISTLEDGLRHLVLTEPERLRGQMLEQLADALLFADEPVQADSRMGEAIAEYQAIAERAADDVPKRKKYKAKIAAVWSDRAQAAVTLGDRARAFELLAIATQVASDEDIPNSVRKRLELKVLKLKLSGDVSDEVLRYVHAERRRLRSGLDDPEFAVEGRILLADFWLRNGEPKVALGIAQEAWAIARDHPTLRWGTYLVLARAQRANRDWVGALATLDIALVAARAMDGVMPGFVSNVLAQIAVYGLASSSVAHRERANDAIDELRARGDCDGDALSAALQARATYLLQDGTAPSWQLAIADLLEAERCTNSPERALIVASSRSAAHRLAGKTADALAIIADNSKRIEKVQQVGLLPAAQSRSWIRFKVGTFEAAAFLAAELGHTAETLEWLERGRAIQLRAALEQLRPGSLHPAEPGPMKLEAPGTALLYLCASSGPTLIAGLVAGDEHPIVDFVDISQQELDALIPHAVLSGAWTERIFAAAASLSERLGPVFSRFADRCQTLFVVPDSSFFFLPFGALRMADGSVLVEKCAVAVVPSLEVLRHCRAGVLTSPKRSCLSIGIGRADPTAAGDSNDFEYQATLIAELAWTSSATMLGAAASSEELLKAMPDFDVVHIAAHGKIDGLGQLSSSRLVLTEGELSARDVSMLRRRLVASEVFLNACLAGRFETPLPGEVGGFVEAFLRAGASTVIAPLCHVHPEHASALAREYHRLRLAGRQKAEALRLAQLHVRSLYDEPAAWAAHVLFGDA